MTNTLANSSLSRLQKASFTASFCKLIHISEQIKLIILSFYKTVNNNSQKISSIHKWHYVASTLQHDSTKLDSVKQLIGSLNVNNVFPQAFCWSMFTTIWLYTVQTTM